MFGYTLFYIANTSTPTRHPNESSVYLFHFFVRFVLSWHPNTASAHHKALTIATDVWDIE